MSIIERELSLGAFFEEKEVRRLEGATRKKNIIEFFRLGRNRSEAVESESGRWTQERNQ